jgi:hypothetical protein
LLLFVLISDKPLKMRFILNLCIHLRYPYVNKFSILPIHSVRNRIKHLRLRDLLVKCNFLYTFSTFQLEIYLYFLTLFPFLVVVTASYMMHLNNVGNQILLLEGVQFIENFNIFVHENRMRHGKIRSAV